MSVSVETLITPRRESCYVRLRKGHGPDLCRRKRNSTHHLAAFQKKGKLTHRELDRSLGPRRIPETRESALLETLHVNAKSRSIPQQYLRSRTRAVHEKKAVSIEGVARQLRSHDSIQAIEAFAQVGGLCVGEDPKVPC